MNNPETDFYYGIGILVGGLTLLITWAIITFGFDTDINIGSFLGVFVLGTYYTWKGIKNGRLS